MEKGTYVTLEEKKAFEKSTHTRYNTKLASAKKYLWYTRLNWEIGKRYLCYTWGKESFSDKYSYYNTKLAFAKSTYVTVDWI